MRRFLFGGLAKTLLWQTLLISVVPMFLIASVALYASSTLARSRFAEETRYVSSTAANGIMEKTAATSSTANLLAEFPTTRALTEAGDSDRLTAFLLPMKQRLGVDILNVADQTGTIIGAGQDSTVGDPLPLPLFRRANAHVQQAWVILDEPEGVVLHAISPIRNDSGDPVGMMDVGVVLGPTFLKSMQLGSNAELALSWDNRVRASTLALGEAGLPTYQEIDGQPSNRLSRSMTVGGKHYFSTFTLIESHAEFPVTLAVFAPLAPVEVMTHALWVLLSVLGLTLCVVVVLVTWRMAHGIIAPFRQLVSAARRIQRGDLSARVQPKAQHEIRILEVAFNTMIDSLGERERERASHEAELLHMASHDPLTGLPNRSLLERALNKAVAEAEHGEVSTLMYLDLDQFKIVNDTLGHNSGDRLLAMVAGMVRSTLRSEDMLARLGGDEFAVLLPGIHVDDAAAVAERVRSVVDECRFVEDGQGFALGLSIGMTAITGFASASEVLGQADIACYTAKSEGRNRVAIYEPEATALALLSGDGRWTIELKDALHEHRLQLVFQPVVRARGGGVDHFETLLRLQDREGNIVGPAEFIPAAERSGLIREIDHWVLNAALDRIREENDLGRRVCLAVNFSGITLGSPESAAYIRAAIEAKGVAPSLLIIEITETALMTNLARVRATIEALRRIGCHFALDDFGTGFSSFAYLAQLPVDSVKIDGSFVRDIATNPVNQAIVRAIATVTHSVGKQCIAEWVEDAETLDALRRIHVDLAQGYYIGYPSGNLVQSGEPAAVKSWSGREHAVAS